MSVRWGGRGPGHLSRWPKATSSGPTPALSNLVLSQEYRGVSFEVDTDTGSGTLYYVVVPGAAAAPDAEQIEAGTDGGDNAATYAASAVVGGSEVATGIPRVLASDTAYAMYFVQKTGGVYSNVVSDTFTSPLIVASGAYNGEDGDFGASGGAYTENYTDPNGGSTAILLTDDGGGSGAVTANMPATFVNGINFADVVVKKIGGAFDALRLEFTSITTGKIAEINIATGAVNVNQFDDITVTDLGSSYFRVRLEVDLTGFPDLTGFFQLRLREAGSYTVTKNGAQQLMISNAFVSDE